jgi:hypothetical protein
MNHLAISSDHIARLPAAMAGADEASIDDGRGFRKEQRWREAFRNVEKEPLWRSFERYLLRYLAP